MYSSFVSVIPGALLCVVLSFCQAGEARCINRGFDASERAVIDAYLAYYGRPADVEGLRYWGDRMRDVGNYLGPLIEEFGYSKEFLALYGNLDNPARIERLYQQVFGREADAAGLDWYLMGGNVLRSPLASIALDILGGATGEDASVMYHRRKVAKHLISRLESAGAIRFSEDFYRSAVETVGADPVSAEASCDQIDGAIVAAGGALSNLTQNQYGMLNYGTDQCTSQRDYRTVSADWEIAYPNKPAIPKGQVTRNIYQDNQSITIYEANSIEYTLPEGYVQQIQNSQSYYQSWVGTPVSYAHGDLGQTFIQIDYDSTYTIPELDYYGWEQRSVSSGFSLSSVMLHELCEGMVWKLEAFELGVTSDEWYNLAYPFGYEPVRIPAVTREVLSINELLYTRLGARNTVKIKESRDNGDVTYLWLDERRIPLREETWDAQGNLVFEFDVVAYLFADGSQ